MSEWRSGRARQVFASLLRIGWTIKRQSGSHRTLSKSGFPDFVFSFHDSEDIGPRMLPRIGKRTGLKPNTVHLTSPPCYPVQNSNRRTGHGTYGGGTSEGGANHRLHQLGGAGQDLSQGEDPIRVVRPGENERSPARFAGPRGHLLRDRPGAVHAVVLPRGAALPSGGDPVAGRSLHEGQSGRENRGSRRRPPGGGGAVAATA